MTLQQDYLMQLIEQFTTAIRRARSRAEGEDYQAAADAMDAAITSATGIDASTLFSLSPESIAAILSVTGVDPNVTEYIAKSMQLQSHFLGKAGDAFSSDLRLRQAEAIASAYGFTLEPIKE